MSPPTRWRSALSILIVVAMLAAILFTMLRLLPFRVGGSSAADGQPAPADEGEAGLNPE